MRTRRSVLLLAGLASACAWACSGAQSTTPAANGGTSSSVGGSSSGGESGTGGAPTTGGASSNVGPTTGGAVSAGGAQPTGGALATGGNQPTATGGASATGGSKAATGGRAFGGRSTVGGTAAIAGSKATGGTKAAGGSFTAGGTTGAGGGTCVPDYSCTPTAPNTGDIYADCVARINQFRACVCLPPVTRNTAAEACLDQDAQNDQTKQIAHNGFTTRPALCTPQGNAQNECPGWSTSPGISPWSSATQDISQCIQMMFNEGPPPAGTCDSTCYEQHGHFINMTGNFTQAACGFYSANGGVTAVQDFYP